MRVTGGRLKGRLLAPLKGLEIRPTSDKVRESIFNIIGQDVSSLQVLDLFAGTGALGIEALSRGAGGALFVERSIRCIRLIERNLKQCGHEASGHVLRRDLTRGLPIRHDRMKERFGLVFIDPPYGQGLIPPLLQELSRHSMLGPDSLVVTESSKDDYLPDGLEGVKLIKTKTYGVTRINIYVAS